MAWSMVYGGVKLGGRRANVEGSIALSDHSEQDVEDGGQDGQMIGVVAMGQSGGIGKLRVGEVLR